jgi:hypothetical protein
LERSFPSWIVDWRDGQKTWKLGFPSEDEKYQRFFAFSHSRTELGSDKDPRVLTLSDFILNEVAKTQKSNKTLQAIIHENWSLKSQDSCARHLVETELGIKGYQYTYTMEDYLAVYLTMIFENMGPHSTQLITMANEVRFPVTLAAIGG